MSISIENKTYLTTEEAAQTAGYTIDYVGQLCRNKKIACTRVSGHWFVERENFHAYLQSNGIQPRDVNTGEESSAQVTGDGVVMHDGVEYISTARAADLTGYTQDYVGQLARSGEVAARKVGRRWFTAREALLKHKKENALAPAQDSIRIDTPESAKRIETNDPAKCIEDDTDTNSVSVPIHTPKEQLHLQHSATPTPATDVSFNVTYTSETDTPLIPKLHPREPAGLRYERHDIPEETSTPIAREAQNEPEQVHPRTQSKVVRTVKKPSNYVSRIDSINRTSSSTRQFERYKSRSDGMRGPLTLVSVSVLLLVGAYYITHTPGGSISVTEEKATIQHDILKRVVNSAAEVLPGHTIKYTSALGQ